MKTDLYTFLSAANGLTLVVLAETPIEEELLKGFARHGVLSFVDGQFRVTWDFKSPDEQAKGESRDE